MPLYDLSGTAAGAGSAIGNAGLIHYVSGTGAGAGSGSFGPGMTVHHVGAPLVGEGAFDITQPVQVMIFSGRVYGQGSFTDTTTIALMGTATGSSDVMGTAGHFIGLSGASYGHGSFDVSIPEPIFGVGTLVGFADVLRVPPPLCGPLCGCHRCCGRSETDCHDCEEYHRTHNHQGVPWWWQCFECWERHAFHGRGFWIHDRHKHHREWTRRPNPEGLIPDFRWNHTFGKGDLEICIHDRQGNQRGPVFIGYTMFMVSSTGVKHQVGPTDRKPAKADVGKFYVTGTAGENGQPGCWAIRWRYQRTYSDPITEQLMQFRVVDAVLAGDRDDHRHGFRRHHKYGWDP